MSTERKPLGPFTLWRNYGYDGWQWEDFATIEDALNAERYGQPFVIQRAVNYEIVERAETPFPPDP